MSATSVISTALTERLTPGALPYRASTTAARRDRKVVKSGARRDARRAPTFPLHPNDLRNTGATGVRGLFSADSHISSYSSLTAPHKQHTAPSTAPLNDNVKQKQKRQKSDAAQNRITTSKVRIAARILDLFRSLQANAGNDRLHAFTLRIHPAIFSGVENPANHMQRIIARRLKEFLGRDVKFVGVMEWRTDDAGELHLHGAILLAPGDERRASEALRAAGGPWRDKQGRARQVDIRPIDSQASFARKSGLEGWALYCTEDSRQTQLELNRRREALDPQQQHFRAPNIILKSGLNAVSDVTNSKRPPAIRDVTKISDVKTSIEDHMGRHKEEPAQRFTVRIKETDLAELDGWIARQGDESLNRQGGILRLVEDGIRDVKNSVAITDVDNSAAINHVMNSPSALDPRRGKNLSVSGSRLQRYRRAESTLCMCSVDHARARKSMIFDANSPSAQTRRPRRRRSICSLRNASPSSIGWSHPVSSSVCWNGPRRITPSASASDARPKLGRSRRLAEGLRRVCRGRRSRLFENGGSISGLQKCLIPECVFRNASTPLRSQSAI